MVAASLDMDVLLTCSIDYESPTALMAANPSLSWSTDLITITDQQSTFTNLERYTSILNITAVDSSSCGTYTCTASDSFVAQSSQETVTVDVGKL